MSGEQQQRRYFCTWCGEEVSRDDVFNDRPRVYSCGAAEYERELGRDLRAAEEEAAEARARWL